MSKYLEPFRRLKRILPPRDKRFLLQDLETVEKRDRFIASGHYRSFLAAELNKWKIESSATTDNPAHDTQPPACRSIYDHPIIVAERNRRFGYGDGDLWSWISNRYGKLERVLLPGAGECLHARILIELDISREVVATDIVSPPGLDRYRPKIQFNRQDMNLWNSDDGDFDACLGIYALHHFINLENIFARINRSLLQRNGSLIVEDYAGPNYLEFGGDVQRICNRILAEIPERYRIDRETHKPLRRLQLPNRWWIQKTSPFESIRSERIVDTIAAAFDVQTINPGYGALLMNVVTPIIHNFHPGDADGNALLLEICNEEKRLTESGRLPNCHAFIHAKAKP